MADLTPPKRSHATRRPLLWLSLCLPALGLVGLDLALRAAGAIAPEDPLLFYERTRSKFFSPFVEAEDGSVGIRPNWINEGNSLRGRRGLRAGRHILVPGFRPVRFAKEKREGAIRIFALGGSTTFGLYVGAESAFPAQLERRLRETVRDRPLEVINLGCAGWASDRVANLLGTVLEFDPHLVVVYTGHNEMLRGHLGTPRELGLALRLRRALLRVSTLFGWLNHAHTFTLRAREFETIREEAAALEAGHILTYEPRLVPPHERSLPEREFFDRVAEEYAKNLRAMMAEADASGVPLLFVLPISNLLFPPSLPTHGEGFERQDEFRREMDRAQQLVQQGEIERALRHFDRAAELSPRNALVPYRRALAFASVRTTAEALADLQSASNLDVRSHRITAQLETTMIESVERSGGLWIDLRPAFRRELTVEAAKELFVDHLHPTKRGHGRIAELLAPAAAELLGFGS